MRGNITKTTVDRLAEGWLWDSGPRAVVGFGARRQTDGVFYYLRYRIGGRQRMKSIGRHGSPWTVDQARNEARRLLGEVAGGVDPSLQPPPAQPLGALVERYLTVREASLKPRSFVEIQRHLRQHAKPLHNLTPPAIDRRAIAEQLARIEIASGPFCRNRVRSSLSRFFHWAIAEGLAETNPVTGTAKAAQASRRRVLTDAELALVWRNLGADRYGDIVRLLILTAQRREEIGGLRWEEIVSDGPDGPLIVLPPERTKNSREHRLPLSRQAQEIIDRQPRLNSSPHIFAGGSWSKAKAALDTRIAATGATLAPWRIHDLRRTAATKLGDLGVLPHVVEAILNHVSGFRAGVAGVYNRARYETEMGDALTRWADYIEAIEPQRGLRSGSSRPKSIRLVRVRDIAT